MAKKGSRLREFEKNNRVLDITSAQRTRKEKRAAEKQRRASQETVEPVQQTAKAQPAPKKKKRSRVKLVSTAVAVVFLLFVGISVKNIFVLQGQARALTDEQEELKKQRDDLTVELENVSSDEYIEEQARKALKLVKGNELIFYFPEEMTIAAQKAAEEGQRADGEGEQGKTAQDTRQNENDSDDE